MPVDMVTAAHSQEPKSKPLDQILKLAERDVVDTPTEPLKKQPSVHRGCRPLLAQHGRDVLVRQLAAPGHEAAREGRVGG